ncbi:MAG: DUF523 and DUF1722 domain-containing protein [Clostridia bacterium]|nr:DUF523 and DUF1722 domain-containing protein [Clostridia bacterium]
MMKPKILISKCIEHCQCRYDGTMIKSDFVQMLKPFVEFITVCPEVEMGLSIPRQSLRLIYHEGNIQLIESIDGQDHTEKMNAFIRDFPLEQLNIHGSILKNRSPSCGISSVKTYSSHGKVPALAFKSVGMFARALQNHYEDLPIEDEGRLSNYVIRDHFLTSIFTLARFNPLNHHELVEFHSQNKYLLMAYHQKNQKIMGRIVANHENLSFEAVKKTYYIYLKGVFLEPVHPGKNENVILHMFGYFSQQLSIEERNFYLEQIKLYRQHKLPFPALMAMMYSWIIRFDVEYLKQQTIFEPYPKEILNLRDSGKERI